MQAFGIAALVFAIIGIIVPFGYFVSTVSALLAFFSSGRGTALGAASVIINIINIYMLSPTLLFTVGTARIARKTQELSGQEMIFLVLILIQIAALSFIAAHWLFSSIEDNEESENTIMVKNAIKSFFVLILGVVSIFSIGLAGKTAFAIKKPQRPYAAAKAVPERPVIARVSTPPKSTGKSWTQYGFSDVNADASIKKYINGYRGIFTGVSSLQDVCKELGAPIRIEETKNGNNYIFKEVTVNFSGKDKEKANTIIIDNDYSYTDINGIKLGDMVNEIDEKIKGRRSSGTITDEKNGIVYWHNAIIIKRIVLTKSIKIQERNFSQDEVKTQENNARLYKITGQNGQITYTNDPAKAAAQKASPVELKPLETVRLMELTGYVIYLKDGRIIDSKAASSDGRTVRFKEGKINIGMPVEEVDDVKGLYRAGNETSAKSLDFRGGF